MAIEPKVRAKGDAPGTAPSKEAEAEAGTGAPLSPTAAPNQRPPAAAGAELHALTTCAGWVWELPNRDPEDNAAAAGGGAPGGIGEGK